MLRILCCLHKVFVCGRPLFCNLVVVSLSHYLQEACPMVMLLSCLHKALHGGLLFCNLIVVKLSCFVCKACVVNL